jgi:uncharacterized membrane protein YhiD involved in acid resistance
MPAWLHDALLWLQDALQTREGVPLSVMLIRLCAAFLLGCIAAGVYSLTTRRSRGASTAPFLATLVLLSTLIALVTMVIGDKSALAFSLVGILGIVRFRTVVEDTRDTAFVIFAVVVGMGAGVGFIAAPLAGTPLVLLGAWLFRPVEQAPGVRETLLVLRLGAIHPPDERLREVLTRLLGAHRLVGLATARGGAALDATYAVRLPSPDAAFAVVSELSRLEGVQSVELKDR